ncbi:MAG: hypothetical protein JWO98_5298 [Frankiales bacterium]|nr:hypothetical protein [Frankiales bacterium]
MLDYDNAEANIATALGKTNPAIRDADIATANALANIDQARSLNRIADVLDAWIEANYPGTLYPEAVVDEESEARPFAVGDYVSWDDPTSPDDRNFGHIDDIRWEGDGTHYARVLPNEATSSDVDLYFEALTLETSGSPRESERPAEDADDAEESGEPPENSDADDMDADFMPPVSAYVKKKKAKKS